MWPVKNLILVFITLLLIGTIIIFTSFANSSKITSSQTEPNSSPDNETNKQLYFIEMSPPSYKCDETKLKDIKKIINKTEEQLTTAQQLNLENADKLGITENLILNHTSINMTQETFDALLDDMADLVDKIDLEFISIRNQLLEIQKLNAYAKCIDRHIENIRHLSYDNIYLNTTLFAKSEHPTAILHCMIPARKTRRFEHPSRIVTCYENPQSN